MYIYKEHIYSSINSKVYRAIRISDSKNVIIKYIPIRKLITANREIEHLKMCIGKKHIVQILDSHTTDKGTYIILEDCSLGSLQSLSGTLELSIVKKYTREILMGLYELKTLNLCYCDLKLANVIIDKDNTLKLCDLGSSQKYKKKDKHLTKLIGTPIYMSPEHIKSRYDYPADIWSLGILVYHLIYNKYPWNLENINNNCDIFNMILNVQPDLSNLPQDIYDFISKCLDISPFRRLTIEEAIEHPFVRVVISDLPIIQDVSSHM